MKDHYTKKTPRNCGGGPVDGEEWEERWAWSCEMCMVLYADYSQTHLPHRTQSGCDNDCYWDNGVYPECKRKDAIARVNCGSRYTDGCSMCLSDVGHRDGIYDACQGDCTWTTDIGIWGFFLDQEADCMWAK